MDNRELVSYMRLNQGVPIIGEVETQLLDMSIPRYVDVFNTKTKQWVKKLTGTPVQASKIKNVVKNDAREDILTWLLNLGAAPDYFGYGSIGSSAANTTNVSLGRLESELIGEATRPALTDALGGALTTADITPEVMGSSQYKIITAFEYSDTDGNNGSTINELGVHTDVNTPASPTTVSGRMLSRNVLPSGVFKDAFTFSVLWTYRI